MSSEQERDDNPNQDRRSLVRSGYERIAEQYLASKEALDDQSRSLLEWLIADVPPGVPVLDLGCGAGVPVTQWLAERRPVVGVDLARRQLALARQHVPNARLIQADMTEAAFASGAFGAVVSMYAIIHIPREQHASLLTSINRWLRPGGRFLATWPMSEWEGEERDWLGWGAAMWWSHFGREENLKLLERAGFAIEQAVDRHGPERWCWVLARKSG